MGCGCNKNKPAVRQQRTSAGRQENRIARQQKAPPVSPHKIPVRALVKNFHDVPRPFVGKRTGVYYGKQKNGNQIIAWKSDVDNDPERLEVVVKSPTDVAKEAMQETQ